MAPPTFSKHFPTQGSPHYPQLEPINYTFYGKLHVLFDLFSGVGLGAIAAGMYHIEEDVFLSAAEVELVSKELNHFGGIASFFRDWAPGTLTGGAYTNIYLPPVSVPGAQSWQNNAIPPK